MEAKLAALDTSTVEAEWLCELLMDLSVVENPIPAILMNCNNHIVIVSPLETHRRETAGDTMSRKAPGTAGGPWSLGQRPRSWHTNMLRGSPGVPPDLYLIRKVSRCSEWYSKCTNTLKCQSKPCSAPYIISAIKKRSFSLGSHWIHALVAQRVDSLWKSHFIHTEQAPNHYS